MRNWEAFVRAHLSLPDLQPEREQRIVCELAAQLEDFYRDGLSRGLTDSEADAFAGEQIHDWECLASDVRGANAIGKRPKVDKWLDRKMDKAHSAGGLRFVFTDLMSDMRHAFRRLGKSPGFSLATVLTLALGIGANAAIFSLVHGIVIHPLPYSDPDRIVNLWHSAPGLGADQFELSPGTFVHFRDGADSFEALALYDRNAANVTGGSEPERIDIARVTSEIFPVLRVSPALGRALSPEDDEPGAVPVAVLSHELWRRSFGSDPAVLGRTIQLDGVSHEIVGVLTAGLSFPHRDVKIWIPFGMDFDHPIVDNFSYRGIGRLKRDVSATAAASELKTVLERLPDRFPEFSREMMESTGFTIKLRPMKDDLVGNIRETLWILLGTVGFVLLIACANVANLFLVRAESRQKEVAVRAALGAGRGRITRFFLTEAVILGLFGGLSGLFVAHVALQLVKDFGPTNLPRLGEVGMNAEALLFTGTLSLLAGLLFGATPIYRTRRTNLVETLKEGGRSSNGRARHRMRSTLVVVQVALALVLLVGSGLMARSFLRLREVEPGFDPSSTLTMRLSLPEIEYPGIEDVASFVRELSERVESIPSVKAAGTTTVLPLLRGDNFGTRVEEHPVPEGGVPLIHPVRFINPDYFDAMGIPLISGRTFDWADQEQSKRVAVVSRAFAEKYWPGESPLGKRLSNFDFDNDEWHAIVGVVGDVRASGLEKEPQQTIFVPLTGHDEIRRSFSLAIRTTGLPEYLTDTVRNEIRAIDPNLPVSNVQTLEELLSSSTARTSFAMTMLAIAAGVALLLGAIGIYGVITYVVSLRTQEIGIRIALGASRRSVSRMVLKQGICVVLVGILIGLVGSVALTRLLQSFLFEVSPLDPLTFATVSVVMVAIGVTAGLLPARRAAAVDPVLSLHEE